MNRPCPKLGLVGAFSFVSVSDASYYPKPVNFTIPILNWNNGFLSHLNCGGVGLKHISKLCFFIRNIAKNHRAWSVYLRWIGRQKHDNSEKYIQRRSSSEILS